MKLFRYKGPVFRFNTVRNRNWLAYVKAYSIKQALLLLEMRYKKENVGADYVLLKEKYLEEVE